MRQVEIPVWDADEDTIDWQRVDLLADVDQPLFEQGVNNYFRYAPKTDRGFSFKQMVVTGNFLLYSNHGLMARQQFMHARHVPLLDDTTAQDTFWFHSSSSHPELFLSEKDRRSEDGFHAGTLAAALDRRRIGDKVPRRWLYVLKAGVRVNERWIADDGGPSFFGATVARYINEYEFPGSICITGNSVNFKVVDVIDLRKTQVRHRYEDQSPRIRKALEPYVTDYN